MNGLQSPVGPSGCDSESPSAEWERNAPPDVEPAGAVKFRIVGETNGSPYQPGGNRLPITPAGRYCENRLMCRNRYVAGTANSRLSMRSRNPP
ncbi:hypothetical protein GCM10017784_04220 [Deinococcus indicus]|nr:hypothetical protein GCM10017784_04220 [Deinococcus indicus]